MKHTLPLALALVFCALWTGCDTASPPAKPDAIASAILQDAEFKAVMERVSARRLTGDKTTDLAAFQSLLVDEQVNATMRRVFERHGATSENMPEVGLALRVEYEERLTNVFHKVGGCADVLQAETAVVYAEYQAGVIGCAGGAGDVVGIGVAPICVQGQANLAQLRYEAAYARYWLCVDGD